MFGKTKSVDNNKIRKRGALYCSFLQIPLFRGVRSAIYEEIERDWFHGTDGFGDLQELPQSIQPKCRKVHDANELGIYLSKELQCRRKGISLMSLGSLTFTTTLLLQQPDLKVDGIWIMGGNDLSELKSW